MELWVKMETNGQTSCANIHKYETKSVKAVLSAEGVKGIVQFTQDHPYAVTTIDVNLQVT